MSRLPLTPFERARRAARLVDVLISELDENKIAAEIDAPIDQALADLSMPPPGIAGYENFLRVVAAFIDRVHRVDNCDDRIAAAPLKLDEAAAALAVYQGPTDSGHDAAVLDGRQEAGEKVDLVLVRLGEAMKAIRREKRFRRLETQYNQGIDWETRCAMVTVLLSRCRPAPPESLATCRPEQLAGELFSLVRTVAT